MSNTRPVIEPDEVGRLFEPFRQRGAERIRPGEGHGLGLAIVRAIADAHGAALTARARPQGGLAIDVSFPARPTDGAATSRRPGTGDVVGSKRPASRAIGTEDIVAGIEAGRDGAPVTPRER